MSSTGLIHEIMRHIRYVFFIFFVCTPFFLIGCNQHTGQEASYTLNIGYGRYIDCLPLYVAVDHGFFLQHGVQVNLRVVRDAKSTIGAIMHGDLDGGFLGFPQIVFSLERNVPIKVIAWSGRSHPGTRCGLHVWKNSDIQKIEDLKGKKIALGRDVSTRTLISTFLARHGMTLNDVKIVLGIELGEPMKTEAAFKSDRVSAIYT